MEWEEKGKKNGRRETNSEPVIILRYYFLHFYVRTQRPREV